MSLPITSRLADLAQKTIVLSLVGISVYAFVGTGALVSNRIELAKQRKVEREKEEAEQRNISVEKP
ncbi:hypothetical protein BJ684DRAFT_21687 [Piptocephalis cylindrospora]|uniref:Uncharacterized protein n=1 Tax=Piptocephalis cylindrospora TaxID=1907219 RepID=A0A4P9XZY7_9FUNG|nr:hypothetical protein BJ684DRAFT_21687 [Piptocephalis cylindrospora]|eukprot:RKP11732.1 hypothetical protein BJ684DRAFT_21687 [Piptocephalis cylindrospora]